jgi:AcrR family transcriptional regulator
MSPKQDVSEERKNQILDAAMNIFAKMGFHHARMDDVAHESGLSKGALYWYFKSKDAIIAAILERLFNMALKDLKRLEQAGEESVRAGLMTYAQQMLGYIHRMKPLWPMMYEFYALIGRQKTMQQFVKGYYREYIATMAGLIRRGIERGEFKEVDPVEVAITLVAIFEGMTLIWVVDAESLPLEKQLPVSMRLLLDSIQKSEKEH